MAHILPPQPDGPTLQETTEKIVNELKSRGNFDTFRKHCLADVDTRPAYQNLRQRVESTVTTFLGKQKWTPDLNRNQLRERLRKHLSESRFLEIGVDRIVDQVVDRNIYTTYMPQIQLLVKEMLDIKDETEDKIDDDVEMEEATPETGGNTFGTWANQFHARAPEPRPDEPAGASNSSMSISSASNESAAGSGSEPDSPDIRAQMSPLSDDGKQSWGSFLGKADGLDFSGIMNRVGHMDPAIDQMIKLELETDNREAETSAAPVPAQRSGSSNSNMSLEEQEPVDLQSFVGPPDGADSQDGHRRDADREPPPRPPRDEPDRGGRGDAEPRGGRHPSDEERRRRERDRDRGRRERSRHDDERSRHGDEDRHRRDRDRDRERRDRDRGDDHEEQRSRGRHHQRRDRDDDDQAGHRGRSGGHSNRGGRGHGRDDDRGGGGGGGGGSGSGQRYHGYGNGRERPDGVQGEPVDGVAAEVVVAESGKEAVDVSVKSDSGEVGEVDASSEGERTVRKDTSREKDRKATSKERDRKATSRERDRKVTSRESDSKRSGSGSRSRGSSSAHKKSSRSRDRSSERRSSSKKRGSSSEKHSGKRRKQLSVERSSTNTPASPPTSPLANKSSSSASKELTAESVAKTKVDSGISSPVEDIKFSNSTKPSSSSVLSSRKSESSKYKSRTSDLNDKLSKSTVMSVEKLSKSMTGDKQPSKSSSSSTSKSIASSSTKPKQFTGKSDSGSKAPLSAKDRMAQLMEKYAPYLKDRFRRSEPATKPKPKPLPPQNTYLGERERPASPSSRSAVRHLRQAVAEPDTLSVSSVDTADLSDFDDRLEMELELTEPERASLFRIGWRPVADHLADVDDDFLATAAEDLVQVVDLCDDVESVDSGFNRSDASSATSAGSGPRRLPMLIPSEPPLIDLEPPPVAGRRRQRKVDYISLNSGLDGEDKAAEPSCRRRPRNDSDWSPAGKTSRVGPGAELLPRVSLHRLPAGKLRGMIDQEQWHVSSDKENMDGMTRLRDPGAAGDSVRIRPNLAI